MPLIYKDFIQDIKVDNGTTWENKIELDIEASYNNVALLYHEDIKAVEMVYASRYKKNSDDEALTISTIHSAKGLEWDSVFIIGAVDGRFPSAYSFNSEEEMDEELRLMYVATTRAKNNLYITNNIILIILHCYIY